jgi:transcriptional antiterminator RfaH
MWFVAHTKPREENRALENLITQGFEVFLPTLTLEKVRRGKLCIVTEPMFSRYLFINTESNNQNFASIRSTRGVHELLRFGHQPCQVPDQLVLDLRNQSNTKIQPLLDVGDKIKVANGPLLGLTGIYQGQSGSERAKILVDFLSKVHLLELDSKDILPNDSYD